MAAKDLLVDLECREKARQTIPVQWIIPAHRLSGLHRIRHDPDVPGRTCEPLRRQNVYAEGRAGSGRRLPAASAGLLYIGT
jgi:hypothetical protein